MRLVFRRRRGVRASFDVGFYGDGGGEDGLRLLKKTTARWRRGVFVTDDLPPLETRVVMWVNVAADGRRQLVVVPPSLLPRMDEL